MWDCCNRVAIGSQAPRQLGLRQRLAGLLLVELAGFLDAQGALDEGQAAVQLVLGQVAGQRDHLAALGPGPEQAGDAEEAFVLRLAPQLAQDGESRVAAIADDVGAFAGATGDRGRRVQPALADRGLDLVVERVARDARVVVIRAQLVQRHDHRRVGDGIAQRIGDGPLRSKPVGQQLGRHVLRGQFSHRRRPPWSSASPGTVVAVGAAQLRAR